MMHQLMDKLAQNTHRLVGEEKIPINISNNKLILFFIIFVKFKLNKFDNCFTKKHLKMKSHY